MKKAFKMKLYSDQQEEYQKRHEALWPEMRMMLQEYGATSYTIFLDSATDELFGYLEIEDESKWQQAATTAINQKWWTYMADIMETNPDASPVVVDLQQVFEL